MNVHTDLVDLLIPPELLDEVLTYAGTLPSLRLTRRQICDLEMLATGAFSPLNSFMASEDYHAVIDEMRLVDGTVFPIPVTLSTDYLTNIDLGRDIALLGEKNDLLAVLTVDEIYGWDREAFATAVCETTDTCHPLVAELTQWGQFNLSGKLRVLRLPEYHDFPHLRLTPKQTRERLAAMGHKNVVAFQTRNPIHRAHEALTKRALEIGDSALLLHPAVGMTKADDIDHFTRVRTYQAFVDLAMPKDDVLLALAPLAMRMAGPREAVWHAIIRRNYGASHFIVGRDHASPGTDSQGRPFYEPEAAAEVAREFAAEIGIEMLSFPEFVYLAEEGRYEQLDKVAVGSKTVSLSGSVVRGHLHEQRELPEWFMRPEIAAILAASFPPPNKQGLCLWFTGLSGSGKSTTAEIVTSLLMAEGRRVTLLDGDVVRTHLSKGLGFSKEDREINIARIGFVASEIVRHGGVAICAAISPYRESREQVRALFPDTHFIEIFVDTPLEICETRDPKGMYARARRGELANFTGVNDTYEPPNTPEITLNTTNQTARQNAVSIIEYLRSNRYLSPAAASTAGRC